MTRNQTSFKKVRVRYFDAGGRYGYRGGSGDDFVDLYNSEDIKWENGLVLRDPDGEWYVYRRRVPQYLGGSGLLFTSILDSNKTQLLTNHVGAPKMWEDMRELEQQGYSFWWDWSLHVTEVE